MLLRLQPGTWEEAVDSDWSPSSITFYLSDFGRVMEVLGMLLSLSRHKDDDAYSLKVWCLLMHLCPAQDTCPGGPGSAHLVELYLWSLSLIHTHRPRGLPKALPLLPLEDETS